jgi:hypothetical protein
MANIQNIYDDFMAVYNFQCSMIVDSTTLLQNNVPPNQQLFSHGMYNAIVEQSFMRIYLAWETFLEKSFIIYLQGETDLKGTVYIKFGNPKDNEHAYNMLKGTKNYPDWTNIDDVNQLAGIYFDNSGPFATLVAPPPEMLAMKTIRNRISHVSEKSLKQYNRLLMQNISQTNIAPGDYLMQLRSGTQTYFTFYVEMLKDYVEAICNK